MLHIIIWVPVDSKASWLEKKVGIQNWCPVQTDLTTAHLVRLLGALIMCLSISNLIQLYCSFNESELHKLADLKNCVSHLKDWLMSKYLQLTSKKTETLITASEHKVQLIQHHLVSLSSSSQPNTRNLAFRFHQSISLDSHWRILVKKNCFYHLRNVSKLRVRLSESDLEIIIHAFIASCLDYCHFLFVLTYLLLVVCSWYRMLQLGF